MFIALVTYKLLSMISTNLSKQRARVGQVQGHHHSLKKRICGATANPRSHSFIVTMETFRDYKIFIPSLYGRQTEIHFEMSNFPMPNCPLERKYYMFQFISYHTAWHGGTSYGPKTVLRITRRESAQKSEAGVFITKIEQWATCNVLTRYTWVHH